MARSYKLKTYPTLHPWVALHKQIIEEYERYHNKAEFVRMALENFAENGFPGILTVQVESSVISKTKADPDIQKLVYEEKDTIQQMEEELGDLF